MLNTDTLFEKETRKGAVNPNQLSPIDLKIVTFISEGLSTKQIAAKIGKSHRSVDCSRKNIMNRLEAINAAHLVSILYKSNVLKCN